jgi:hypothetical protein
MSLSVANRFHAIGRVIIDLCKEVTTESNGLAYLEHMHQRHGVTAAGQLNSFISRRDGHLLIDDRIDLNDLVHQYGAPLRSLFAIDYPSNC